ncbi:MAG: polysaccharide deacetylase family protein [Chloroflexi bacterium]|nr:polysaccharide deacetylase family protein [Chloroflexota bacterium]
MNSNGRSVESGGGWRKRLPAPVRAAGRRVVPTRVNLASVRLCCERHVLARTRAPGRPRSRILCYHSIGTPQWGINDVSPERFRRHLQAALEAGYTFVPASEIASGSAPGRSLALTFDDGIASVAANAAPVLAELAIPWTLFVVTDWADGRHAFGDGTMLTWREIERLAERGAEIGSHSVTHPNFGAISAGQARDEIVRSRAVVGERLGVAPAAFAIPYGRSKDWTAAARAAAAAAGYTTVFAQSEERRPHGTVPRTFITRFDTERVFRAALGGAFDRWEEWA